MSAAFDVALARVQTLVTLAQVIDSNGNVTTVAVDDGQVEVDGTAQIRRHMSGVVISDPKLAPVTIDALLSPFANEMRLSRGLLLPDGTTELYSLGVFGIEDVHVTEDESGLGVVVDSGNDRSAAVSQNAWTAPYPIAPATDVGTAIRAIIADRLPGATFNFALTTGSTTPGLILGTSSANDPWKDASDLATSIGHELFFDTEGVCTLRPIPNAQAAPPAYYYGDGQANPLLAIDRQMTRENSYSQVVGVAESTTLAQPLRSVVSIPSNRPRTYFYRSAYIITQSQLDATVLALLNRYSGVYATTQISGIPDPRLDVGMVGMVSRPSAGVPTQRMLLERFTLGLTPDSRMQATVRIP